MPWTYEQRSRRLLHNGQVVGTGYSGRGAGRNNPAMENVPSTGPIPRGQYRIGTPFTHQTKGPIVMRLTPVGHAALGRSGFLIHGDSTQHPGEASEGCIVLGHALRNAIVRSHDTTLEVTE